MRGPGKGKTNNPLGKPKGTENRTTKESKEFLKQILFAEFDNIQASLKNARQESDSKYIDLLSKLLQFVLPKQVENESSGKIDIKVTYDNRRKPDSGPS
jgi:hypothetical protein